jgi:Fur family ferric uptake transcriptional regulator
MSIPAPPHQHEVDVDSLFQQHGIHCTAQRKTIWELFAQHARGHTAREAIRALKPRGIGAATVYRTLAELVEAGLLKKMSLTGRSVYEHDYGYPSHDHLYCQVCNRLIEFHSAELERIRDAVAREHHFQVISHRVFVTGVCEQCQKAHGAK